MRLRTYHGASVGDVMNAIRREMGPEAFIVSTVEGYNGVKITAALEVPDPPLDFSSWVDFSHSPSGSLTSGSPTEERLQEGHRISQGQIPPVFIKKTPIEDIFQDHGLGEEILKPLRDRQSQDQPQVQVQNQVPSQYPGQNSAESFSQNSLESFLKHGLAFESLAQVFQKQVSDSISESLACWESSDESPESSKFSRSSVPLMLVGSPGVGKTVLMGKLALQALSQGFFVSFITCDTQKSGRMTQLESYAKALQIPFLGVQTPYELKQEIDLMPQGTLILVDTPGLNTYDPQDSQNIREFLSGFNGMLMWVCQAGEHPEETLEKREFFLNLGCSRVIISKIDMTRRLGGALAVLLDKKMALCGLSNSPLIAQGFEEADPYILSQILINREDAIGKHHQMA